MMESIQLDDTEKQLWDKIRNSIETKGTKQNIQGYLELIEPSKTHKIINYKNSSGYTLLHYAAKWNNKESAAFLIHLNAEINTVDFNGQTPLHWATYYNHFDFCAMLISAKAELNIQDNQGKTALALSGNHDIINLLVHNNADFLIRDKKGYSILWFETNAAWAQKVEFFVLAIARKIKERLQEISAQTEIIKNITSIQTNEFKEKIELTPIEQGIFKELTDAIKRGNTQITSQIELIHQNEQECLNKLINYHDDSYGSLLHYCAQYDNKEAAYVLMHYGHQINVRNTKGQTPLHIATYKRNAFLVDELVRKGADVNAQDDGGNVPLHFVDVADKNILQALINKGADITSINKKGTTVLWALSNRAFAWRLDYIFLFFVNYITTRLKEISPQYYQQQSAKHSQLTQANLDANYLNTKWEELSKLVSTNKPIDSVILTIEPGNLSQILSYVSPHTNGNTLLHLAAEHDNDAVAEFLITKKVNVNIKNSAGETPLHIAIQKSRSKIYKRLLEVHGIDLSPTADGKTPLHVVRDTDQELFNLLISRGADITVRDKEGYSCMWAKDNRGFGWRVDYILLFSAKKILDDMSSIELFNKNKEQCETEFKKNTEYQIVQTFSQIIENEKLLSLELLKDMFSLVNSLPSFNSLMYFKFPYTLAIIAKKERLLEQDKLSSLVYDALKFAAKQVVDHDCETLFRAIIRSAVSKGFIYQVQKDSLKAQALDKRISSHADIVRLKEQVQQMQEAIRVLDQQMEINTRNIANVARAVTDLKAVIKNQANKRAIFGIVKVAISCLPLIGSAIASTIEEISSVSSLVDLSDLYGVAAVITQLPQPKVKEFFNQGYAYINANKKEFLTGSAESLLLRGGVNSDEFLHTWAKTSLLLQAPVNRPKLEFTPNRNAESLQPKFFKTEPKSGSKRRWASIEQRQSIYPLLDNLAREIESYQVILGMPEEKFRNHVSKKGWQLYEFENKSDILAVLNIEDSVIIKQLAIIINDHSKLAAQIFENAIGLSIPQNSDIATEISVIEEQLKLEMQANASVCLIQ